MNACGRTQHWLPIPHGGHSSRKAGFRSINRRMATGSRNNGQGAAGTPRRYVKVFGFDKLKGHPMYDPNVSADATDKSTDGEAKGQGSKYDKTGPIRLQASRGGRAGKTVTVITGVPKSELKTVCKKLKAQCGSGGAVKADTIEIQGNHASKLVQVLQDLGYTDSKQSGG